MCCHRTEKGGVKGGQGGGHVPGGIDYTEQWSADQQQPWPYGGRYHTGQIRNLSTKSHALCEGKRRGGLVFELVRVCVGGGADGVKVRKKRRQQRQTKEKVKKRGWGLAWSSFFIFVCLNLIIPL